MVFLAREQGLSSVVVPAINAREAALIGGLDGLPELLAPGPAESDLSEIRGHEQTQRAR